MSKEVRKQYFESFDGKNVFGVDLGTKAKRRLSCDLSFTENFVVGFLVSKEVDDIKKASLITKTQITKALLKSVMDAKNEVNRLHKSGKTNKEIDKVLLKKASLISGGKAKASVVVDKSTVFTAVRYLYLNQKKLFSVALSVDGDFTIKQVPYIEGLIEVKD